MKKSLIFSDDDFLKLIQIQNISYEEFCDKISVLDIMDRSGSFVVHYRVQWSAIKGKRQAKKTRNGNFEDLWIFKK